MASERPSIEGNWVVFEVGFELCALPASTVQEIVPLPWLSRPPGLPPLMEGFLSLGGTVVPVLRMTRLFGLPDVDCSLYTPLVVVRGRNGPLALLVDSVRAVRDMSEGSPAPIEVGHCFNDCTEAQVLLKEGIVHLLSFERLLLEEEARRIGSFREMEAERMRLLEGQTP